MKKDTIFLNGQNGDRSQQAGKNNLRFMKKNLIIFFILFMLGIIQSCNDSKNSMDNSDIEEFGWKKVYKHDKNGHPISGSKDALIAGIRNGYSLKVGWGLSVEREDTTIRIEHIAEPLFLTIIQEKEVSIVIDAHPLLQSYWRIENQQFKEGGHIWQCVLNTTGAFNAQIYHRSTGELIRDFPQQHRMTWYLDYPKGGKLENEPLFE